MLGLLLKVSKLANVDVDWVSERTACWRHGYGQWSCDEHCLYCHAHYTLFNHGLSACRQLRDSLYYASVHCQYHRSVQRVTGPYPPPSRTYPLIAHSGLAWTVVRPSRRFQNALLMRRWISYTAFDNFIITRRSEIRGWRSVIYCRLIRQALRFSFASAALYNNATDKYLTNPEQHSLQLAAVCVSDP